MLLLLAELQAVRCILQGHPPTTLQDLTEEASYSTNAADTAQLHEELRSARLPYMFVAA